MSSITSYLRMGICITYAPASEVECESSLNNKFYDPNTPQMMRVWSVNAKCAMEVLKLRALCTGDEATRV